MKPGDLRENRGFGSVYLLLEEQVGVNGLPEFKALVLIPDRDFEELEVEHAGAVFVASSAWLTSSTSRVA